MKYLSRPEEIVLLSIWRLQDDAYGIPIRKLVQTITGKYWSIGSIYVPLQRLEKKGFVRSFNSDPTPERGGRSKRLFEITGEGREELEKIKSINQALWEGYPAVAWEKK